VMRTLRGQAAYEQQDEIITDQEFNEVSKMILDATVHCVTCNEVIEENKKMKSQEQIIANAADSIFQILKEVEDGVECQRVSVKVDLIVCQGVGIHQFQYILMSPGLGQHAKPSQGSLF